MSHLFANLPVVLGFLTSPMEMIIVGIVAVLLFGKRLPEVGRSLGKGMAEFKKGLQGIEEDLTSPVVSSPRRAAIEQSYEDHAPPTAPKFEAPAAQSAPSEPSQPSQPPHPMV